MRPEIPFFGVIKPNPRPVWFVTNGEIIVGPVQTNLLKRGVELGRVPEHCYVSPYDGRWRKLGTVREVAALYRGPAAASPVPHRELFAEIGRRSMRMRDEDEVCYQIARLARLTTGAESVMFHFRGRGMRNLVTRSVLGPMSTERLNEELPETDAVLRSAMIGRPVFGPPYGLAEDALASRFATSLGGVGGAAMIPIFVNDRLRAMLEVSRPGHAFRRTDLQRAERIAQRALFQHEN